MLDQQTRELYESWPPEGKAAFLISQANSLLHAARSHLPLDHWVRAEIEEWEQLRGKFWNP